MTNSTQQSSPPISEPDARLTVPLRLAFALAVATAAASAATLLVPDLLTGAAVMNGSAKGTALVALILGVPLLVASAWRARSGSTRALAVATGVTAYLVYNAVLFVFATPFNQAFLLYEAMLGLALFTLIRLSLVLTERVDRLVGEVPRWIPAYMWFIVVGNTAVWLAQVLPALIDEEPALWLADIGLTTNPVIAQDLAFWLPVMAWLAWGVWRAQPAATALAAAGLVFWIVEAIGVAVDQWWGHQADPSSTWASAGAVPMFVGLAIVGLLPMVRLLRTIPDHDRPAGSADEAPW